MGFLAFPNWNFIRDYISYKLASKMLFFSIKKRIFFVFYRNNAVVEGLPRHPTDDPVGIDGVNPEPLVINAALKSVFSRRRFSN